MVMCVSESILQWLNLFLAVSVEREKDLECAIMLIFVAVVSRLWVNFG